MGKSAGLLVLEFLFTFVPYLLDTGIQIWNAVEVNNMTLPTVDPYTCKALCPPNAQYIWDCYDEYDYEYEEKNYTDLNELKLKCFQSKYLISMS